MNACQKTVAGICPQFMSDKCICTSLRTAAHASTALYDAYLAPSGLKVTMFRLLRRIAHLGDVSITKLAQEVGLDRSTLGRNLKVLARQDLIVMTNSTDGRARAIKLTETGRCALDTAVPLWAAAQAELTTKIGPELAHVLKTLDALSESAFEKETTQ